MRTYRVGDKIKVKNRIGIHTINHINHINNDEKKEYIVSSDEPFEFPMNINEIDIETNKFYDGMLQDGMVIIIKAEDFYEELMVFGNNLVDIKGRRTVGFLEFKSMLKEPSFDITVMRVKEGRYLRFTAGKEMEMFIINDEMEVIYEKKEKVKIGVTTEMLVDHYAEVKGLDKKNIEVLY